MSIESFSASEDAVKRNCLSSVSIRASQSSAVDQVVELIDNFLQNVERVLEFDLDDLTGLVAITVIDAKRHKTIRRISPEQALKLMTRARDSVTWDLPT